MSDNRRITDDLIDLVPTLCVGTHGGPRSDRMGVPTWNVGTRVKRETTAFEDAFPFSQDRAAHAR